MSQKNRIIGVTVVLLSALGYSAKAIFIKLAYVYGTSPTTLLLLRMLFSMPFYIVIVIAFQRKSGRLSLLNTKDHLMIFLLGALGHYLSSILDFKALQSISASLGRIILFSYPTIVVLLNAWINKAKITKIKVMALIITYSGIVIAFSSELFIPQKDLLQGSSLVLMAAFTYALYYVGSHNLILKIGALLYTSYSMLVSTSLVVLQFILTEDLGQIWQPLAVYKLALGMSVFSTVLPTILIAEGIRRIGSSSAAIVSTIGPIATIFLATIFLGEPFLVLQVLGGFLVICGVLMISFKSYKLTAENP